MGLAISEVLQGKYENHLMPFFWQHGESQEVLLEYVGVIQNAGCDAFCVESRPHPDFVGTRWWHDMDIILAEAASRKMKVWILDDSHFPTGYANGALEDGDISMCRTSVFHKEFTYDGKAKDVTLAHDKLSIPPKYKIPAIIKIIQKHNGPQRVFDKSTDRVYTIVAFGPNGEKVDLTGERVFHKPEGKWRVEVCGLTHNLGAHRSYINMMSEESCKLLIDHVYEPHYEHYKAYFGNTIAGFFSDEPELGNGILYARHNVLGTIQDLPWSQELENVLRKAWGEELPMRLPLLWLNDCEKELTQETRMMFMDAVSKLVQKDFSEQMGNWCRRHGVEYIGHMVEDCDTHFTTGSGLGHYFRGLYGQDMAGIDDIGGQVFPGGEDYPKKDLFGIRNGAFYHYTLGKLGVSAAYLEEHKRGRSICEIFGNYGWKTGVPTMKYLADHFLVRGINNFVPHAFSPKDYPDPDCPPHFYAHGHNPQYRAFGELCRYINRVSSLISDGVPDIKVAIYYNAESDWAGKCMRLDEPARILYDEQIDFLFLPLDEIRKAVRFDVVLIPWAEYVPTQLAELENAVFLESVPKNLKEYTCLNQRIVTLEHLPLYLRQKKLETVKLFPQSSRIHCMHYLGKNDLFLFMNEGDTAYEGSFSSENIRSGYYYFPWENQSGKVRIRENTVELILMPGQSIIYVNDENPDNICREAFPRYETMSCDKLSLYNRSLCSSQNYPDMKDHKAVTLPDLLEKEFPKFSGIVRYEATIDAKEKMHYYLKISDTDQSAVEVFVNGTSLGIHAASPCIYDLTDYVVCGKNRLRIELATTLERENASTGIMGMYNGKVRSCTGLHGEVILYYSGD